MKYLGTMLDNKINKEYDLYSINAKELHDKLKQSYSKKLSDLDYYLFNNDIDYFQHVRMLKQLNRRKEQGFTLDSHYTIEEETKEIEKVVKEIEEGKHHTVKLQSVNELGYELMPIAVSTKNKDIAHNQEIELLDGFRRMFYTPTIPDNEVLVKVYDTVDNTEWINLMIVFNSWKFADRSHAELYMDRGFRLGLFYRYDVDFTNFYSYYINFGWKYIDIYTKKLPYSTFWNNLYAHQDIPLIYQMVEYRPTFKLVKKRSEKVYDTEKENPGEFSYFLEKIYSHIISTFGEIRRKEFSLELKGTEVQRNPFKFEDILEYLEREDLQEHFIKLSSMQVFGFMDNYIEKHLLDDLKSFFQNKYFGEEADVLFKATYVSNEFAEKRMMLFHNLQRQLNKNTTVVYKHQGREISVFKENDKFVIETKTKNYYFDSLEELSKTVLDGTNKSFKELTWDMDLFMIL